MGKKELKDILPSNGIWTVEDLAVYLEIRPGIVMQKLADLGIPVISFGRFYRHKIFRMEDLRFFRETRQERE
jgi:hypothetical protein